MNGIEQMLFNILQGFGIDPQDLMHKANHLMNVAEVKLNSIDQRMTRIENALGILSEDAIEKPDLNIEKLEMKSAESSHIPES